jgi:hypothetical protein
VKAGGIVQKLIFWPDARADAMESRETVAGTRLHERYLGVAPGHQNSHTDVFEETTENNPFEARNPWSLASIYWQTPREKIASLELNRGFGKGTNKNLNGNVSVKVKVSVNMISFLEIANKFQAKLTKPKLSLSIFVFFIF